MLKKTVTYVDYNGKDCTEDLYFNLTKAELAEMELEVKGGLSAHIQKIVDDKDNAGILKVFKDLLLRSYGIKSEDGKRFIKNDQIKEEFAQTEAYSTLFMDIVSNPDAADDFIKAVIPSSVKVPAIPAK